MIAFTKLNEWLHGSGAPDDWNNIQTFWEENCPLHQWHATSDGRIVNFIFRCHLSRANRTLAPTLARSLLGNPV